MAWPKGTMLPASAPSNKPRRCWLNRVMRRIINLRFSGAETLTELIRLVSAALRIVGNLCEVIFTIVKAVACAHAWRIKLHADDGYRKLWTIYLGSLQLESASRWEERNVVNPYKSAIRF